MINSKVSTTIRVLLDELLPPAIRDTRWFFAPIIKLSGAKIDMDFKIKAPFWTEEEFCDAYEKAAFIRSTDLTNKTELFVLENLSGKTLLKVGCGNGDLAIKCAKRGLVVTASDIAGNIVKQLATTAKDLNIKINTAVASAEELPFTDKSFDTIICTHVLEHTRDIQKTINELKRVAQKRVVIVVPKQRNFRYTCDYHLHFFNNPEHLILALGIKNAYCKVIDHCLCYIGNLE